MKEVSLQKSNWYKWYKFFYGITDWDMPTDTCTYYRNLVLSIPLIVPAIGGILFSLIFKDKTSLLLKIIITLVLIFFPTIFGLSFYTSAELKANHIPLYVIWLKGFIFFAILISFIILLILIGAKIEGYKIHKKKAKMPQPPKVKEPSVFKAWIKSVKEKSCSKIKWVDPTN